MEFSSFTLFKLEFDQVEFSIGALELEAHVFLFSCDFFSLVDKLLQGSLVFLVVLESNLARLNQVAKVFAISPINLNPCLLNELKQLDNLGGNSLGVLSQKHRFLIFKLAHLVLVLDFC